MVSPAAEDAIRARLVDDLGRLPQSAAESLRQPDNLEGQVLQLGFPVNALERSDVFVR
jgi:hypothetical protein